MNETTDAIAIFAPLWRRKWLILAVGIVVGAATYLYYRHAQRVFQANTQVYLGASAEEQAPGEKASGKSPASNVSNQAQIINSIVAEGVRHRLRKEHKAKLLRGSSIRTKVAEKSEFITITTEAHTAVAAAQLANLTADAYVRRQRLARNSSIERAIAITRRQLRRVEAAAVPKDVTKQTGGGGKAGEGTPGAGKAGGAGGGEAKPSEGAAAAPSTASVLQAASLSSKINQLEASLGISGAQVVKPAKPLTTVQLAPKPRQSAIFGFVIGIVLASIAAYVLGRFDRRLRSLVEIEAVFGSPTLAGLPKARQPIVFRDGRPTPSRFLLEPLRRLHMGFQLAPATQSPPNGQGSLRTAPRVILFTSADAGDGKSTVVADVALVQRDANQRVVVVEANFRRPVQAKLLGLEPPHGLAEVLVGSRPLRDALQRLHYDEPPMPAYASPPPLPAPATEPQGGVAQGGVATMVESRAGSLSLLAGGGAVSNPPALLGNGTMPGLLRALAEDSDYVLIDTPSPLEVSDVMPLLPLVDGIVVVARAGHTRHASAERLVELLAHTSSAPVLGVCANCVSRKEIERFGFALANGPGKLIGR